jgi:hypothetical protein
MPEVKGLDQGAWQSAVNQGAAQDEPADVTPPPATTAATQMFTGSTLGPVRMIR